ncbi:hypothetical protein COEREDRAFT_80298 [Coemansia reversa NRRL 1564]|uniref:O-acyltransferase n=1 Tax=Coemansia reversa (strain ATCC 12441 / NRRL 1564) TaxID=763665 RepID=A0A2G5BF13_COERN|nr:hypothetical protein COEREDRAFT_80298 [Coemansia reversa NRRL 1564]|eukprot:PIA17593.1 hypothetical protein COEREDRAFT_80298 [Coemansia reversa NRRL 1564]
MNHPDSAPPETLLRRRSSRVRPQTPLLSEKPQHSTPEVRRRSSHKRMPYLQAQVVHYRPRVSVLDKELTTVSYHGLINFLLLLLSATLIRLAIENYMKYGILVRIPGAGVAMRDWLATLAGLFAVLMSFLAAYAVERRAIPERSGRSGITDPARGSAALVGVTYEEKHTVILHVANLAHVLAVPSGITYFAIYQPALGMLVMTSACVMFLKLYSLAATNFDLRRAYRLGDSHLSRDPLRFTSFERGRLIVGMDGAPTSLQYTREPLADKDGSSSAAAGVDAEISCVEDLVHGVVPLASRASFSLNARALDNLLVGGDERIDAKADALPSPRSRLRVRANTASEVLRRVASAASEDAPLLSTCSKDGSLRDNAISTGAKVFWHGCSKACGPDVDTGTQRKVARHEIHYAVAYPHNVTLANFVYFWMAPTLCYQPSYPRIAGPIRKSFVAKRLAELVVLCIAMYVVIYQYAVPTLMGSVRAIDSRNGFWLFERVLKLSVVSAIVWFLGFYAIFHAALNALAELLRFADRAFYLDWWNSVDLAAYWREWNLPIHYFCKRHIMVPLVSAPLSLPAYAGVLLTFLVSAIMHELLFGIPTHCLKGYSFIGMMMQIPLIQLTQWLMRWRGPESGLGNAVFWVSFCIVGQPLGVVQYFYTWIKNNP